MNSALHKRHLVHQDSLNGESQNGQSCRNIGEASHDNHEISLSQKHQQQRRRRKRQMKYTLWRSYSIHNGASGINNNGNIVLFAFATCFFLICIVLIISLPHLHRRKHHPFHAGVNSLLHKKNSKSDLAVSSAFSQNSNNESAKVSNERDENHHLRKPPEKYDPQQNQNQPNNSQLSQRKQSNQSNNPTEALLKCHDYGCAIYPMELSQIIKSMSNTGITHSTSTVNHSSPSAYLASKHHVMITHQSNRMKPRPVNQDRVVFISPFDILDYGNFPNAMEQRKILDGGISLQSAAYSDNTEKDNQQKSENDNSKLSSRRSSKQQTFVPTVNPRDNFFLGVFDGHGDEGEVIAQFSSEEIPSRIVSKLRSDNIPSIGNDIHKRNVPNSEGNNKSGNDHNDIPKVHPNINNDVNSLNSNDAILKLGKQSEDEQETVKQAIIQSFVETDRDSPEKEAMTGGCTATTILRIGNTLYMANTGDSTSFIVLYTPPPGGIQFNATTVNQNKEDPKDKNVYNNNLNMNHNQIVQHLQTPIQGSITIHHQNRRDKPHLPDEMARIKQLGGRIHIPPKHPMGSRVVVRSSVHKEDIGLAMSRSIGDWEWGKMGVIPDPIVEVVDLKSLLLENGGGGAEEGSVKMFVVAGSDGLFDARKVEFVAKNLARGFFESIPDGIDDSGNWNDLQRRYNAHGLKVARELVTAASPMKPEMYRDDISFVSMVVEIDDSIQ